MKKKKLNQHFKKNLPCLGGWGEAYKYICRFKVENMILCNQFHYSKSVHISIFFKTKNCLDYDTNLPTNLKVYRNQQRRQGLYSVSEQTVMLRSVCSVNELACMRVSV